ncbi:transposase, partial [Paenibacillus larvae]|uniref:transposase n=1 Tax=Paenibacillus larvae TaxID=1464 RepID=UPI001F52B7E3
ENKRIYAERKETIERVFADLKEKHGMRWTTLRGLKSVTMQAMLVFSAMNLKRMATWLWKRGRPSDKFNFVFEIGIKNIKNSRYCSISRDFVFNLGDSFERNLFYFNLTFYFHLFIIRLLNK